MALFQVLLITAIFSILLLSMLAFTQSHQHKATRLLQATHEKLVLYSASNQVQFELLTQDWLDINLTQPFSHWNFYNKPFVWPKEKLLSVLPKTDIFDYSEVRIQIQDVRGLLSVHAPGDEFIRWLSYRGIPLNQANSKVEELRQAQLQLDRSTLVGNYPYLQLSSFTDIAILPTWDTNDVSYLVAVSALSGHTFNPANAPDELLAALLPKAQFDIISTLRQQNQFSIARFRELTDLTPEEGATFFPGRDLRITISSSSGRSLVLWVTINSYQKIPVQLSNWYWN